DAATSLVARTQAARQDLTRGLRDEAGQVRTTLAGQIARPELPEVAEPDVGTLVARVDRLAIDLQKKALGSLHSGLGRLSERVGGELDRLETTPAPAPVKKGKGKRKKAKKAKGKKSPAATAAEPWAGYDAMTAREIIAGLGDARGELRAAVAAYEKKGKKRKTVLEAAALERAS
ncbi:MAG: hypothetical protein AAF447_28605, partial [Myxococcota bacterium]